MIKIPVTIQITKGALPAEYEWTSDAPSNVSFSKTTGTTTNGFISTNVIYSAQSVIDTATISINIITAEGCESTLTVAVPNICDDLSLSAITNSNPFEFTVSAGSPGCGSVDFSWGYNENIFNLVSQNDTSFTSTLKLELAGSSLPTGNPISVTASNCDNCTQTSSLSYTACIPSAVSKTIQLTEVGTQYQSPLISFDDPIGCTGYTFDWGTLSANLPTGWSISQVSGNSFYIYAPLTTTVGTYTGTYSVKTDSEIKSDNGTLALSVYAPANDDTIVIADKVWSLDCTANSGDVVELNIEDEITATAAIDWSTWQLVSALGTPKSPSITLGTDTSGDHVIQYTVPNPIEADVFSWTVCDVDGQCAEATTYTITECIAVPILSDDAATVSCGASVNISVLDNDLGNGAVLKNNSIIIVSGPSLGTATPLDDGTITYQSEFNSQGTVTFDYNVMNAAGEFADTPATVTITIDCAGADAEVTICN